MTAPKPKADLGIDQVYPYGRYIWVNGTSKAIDELERFGVVRRFPESESAKLTVDARFSFDEVVAYLRECAYEDKSQERE